MWEIYINEEKHTKCVRDDVLPKLDIIFSQLPDITTIDVRFDFADCKVDIRYLA